MNSIILTFLLCLVCSVVGSLGSEVTFSPGQVLGTGALASGAGVPVAVGDDDDEEASEEHSGGVDNVALSSHERPVGERRKKARGGKRRNKHRGLSTNAPLHPDHQSAYTSYTSGYTSPHSQTTAVDPCTSTHLGFCIHGICKYMEDLQEPVCLCMKGFDGLRCGIQTLGTGRGGDRSEAELVQMVLVVIAVVLSVISCSAILLMTCAHYRNQKNVMSSFIGTAVEAEKLQKPMANVMV